MFDPWIRDLRFAGRRLARRPAYTLLTVLTLALGVAGTAAVFSIARQLLLEPVPARDEERIAVFWMVGGWSEAELLHMRPEIRGFESLAIFRPREVTMQPPGGVARLVNGVAGSAELFDVLGVGPVLGPGFREGDDREGGQPVVVLSHGFWRELGGDPSIIGQQIELGGVQRTVAGVMPEGFWFPDPMARVWMSEELNPADGSGNWGVIGRMSPGTTQAAVHGELARLMPWMHQQFDYPEGEWDKRVNPHVTPLREFLVGSMRPSLLATLAAMAVILLIASVNVAALMLGQVDSRETELAVRSAMGARRHHLLRQIVTESLLLGAMAGIAGAALALAVFRFLLGALPLGALAEAARIDWVLLGASVAIAILAASLVALAPGLSVSRSNLQTHLTRSRTGGIGGRGGRLEALLVVGQVAMVLLMVAGAGLLIRTVNNLRAIDVGVDVENLAVIDVVIPLTVEPAARPPLVHSLVEAVGEVPGVTSAAATQRLPLRGSSNNWGMAVENRPDIEDAITAFRVVTPGYFETFGIGLLRGRTLQENDRRTGLTEGTVVINQALADRYFPGADPIGWRIAFMNGRWDRIVGVVENVAESELSPEPVPTRYAVYEQVPWLLPAETLVLRTQPGQNPAVVLDGARRAIQARVPEVAIQETTTMRQVLDRAVGPARQVMALLALLGALALVLGAIGVFGVVSHFVTRRRRDWGIRVALGMEPRRVMREIVGVGGALVAAGIVVGLGAFLALARFLRSLLYEVEAADPLALGGAAAILLLAGIVAAWVPAWRASRIDPAFVLRDS